MSTSQKYSALILLSTFLLLALYAFWPVGNGAGRAVKTITFVSPLPVTPVVETRTLTLAADLPPLTTTTTLTPTLPHDLLFVNETGLMRWHHAALRLETIIATIVVTSTPAQEPWHTVEYKTSPDQQQVLVAYGMGIRGEGGTFHLARYEPATAQLTTLMTTTYDISDFMLAPDGSWTAYLLRDTRAKRPWWRTLFKRHACGCDDSYLATVYLLRLQPPYTPQPLQVCGRAGNGLGECGGLVPLLSDQSQLVWQDGAGYWSADAATGAVHFLAKSSQPAIALPNPALNAESPFASPYVISWIVEPRALSFGLFNRQTWTVTKLPAQAGYSVHTSSLAFLADGRLFWHKPRGWFEVWTLDESQPGTPIRRTIWQLPLAMRTYNMQTTVLAAGIVGLTLERPSSRGAHAAGLYWVDLPKGQLIKVNRLPSHSESPDVAVADIIEWAADGSGALYIDDVAIVGRRNVTYIPADGGPFVELGTTLGQAVEQPTWLLPAAH